MKPVQKRSRSAAPAPRQAKTKRAAAASVIITYFGERRRLLDRCLYLLKHQTVPLEIILADDGDFIKRQPGVDVLLKVRPGREQRSLNRAFRAGFELAHADYIIHCPPEMLVPRNAVEFMMEQHKPGHRDVPTLYALSRETTLELLDELPWQEDLSCLKDTPGFWDTYGPLLMSNRLSEFCGWHLNFSGATREEWLRFDIVPDVDVRAMNENWLLAIEDVAGVSPIRSPITVYHQWHPPGITTLADLLRTKAAAPKPTIEALVESEVPMSDRVRRAAQPQGERT